MTDRAAVGRWLAGYEAAWRSPGTGGLDRLFTEDVTYRQSPYEEPAVGLDAVRRMWDAERAGPDEGFTLATSILAVDGDTGVVRAEVHYAQPEQEYRDLWIIRLTGDGRCREFEEWPYWPDRPYEPGGG
jgi:ketosteroid isomerase-like protein